MTILEYPYTGLADNTVLTNQHTAVTGSGSYTDTALYTAPTIHVDGSYRYVEFSATDRACWFNQAFTAANAVTVAFEMEIVSGAEALMEWWHFRGTGKQGNVLISTTNVATLRNAADANASAAPALTTGTKYVVRLGSKVGTTTSNGHYLFTIHRSSDNTQVHSFTTTTANTGTTNLSSIQVGDLTSTNDVVLRVGRMRIATGTDALDGSGNLVALDPYTVAAATPPVYFATSTTTSTAAQVWWATSSTSSVRIDDGSGTTSGTTAFLTDTFTGAGTTELGAHTADTGQTWSKHPAATGGAIAVEGGEAYCSLTAGVTYVSSATPPSANYYAESTFVFPAVPTNQNLGIAVRAHPTDDTQYRVRYIQASAGFRLDRLVTGSNTVLATYPYAPTAGGTCTVRLSANGNQIQVTIDGVAQTAVTDTGITAAGTVGILGNNSSTSTTGVHLTNITATAL